MVMRKAKEMGQYDHSHGWDCARYANKGQVFFFFFFRKQFCYVELIKPTILSYQGNSLSQTVILSGMKEYFASRFPSQHYYSNLASEKG